MNGVFSLCRQTVGWGEGSLWSPFSKGTNPTHVGSTLMTSSPPEYPTSRYHHIGSLCLAYGFWGGHRYSVCCAYTTTHPCLSPRTFDLCWTSASCKYSPFRLRGPSCPLSAGHPCSFFSSSLQRYLLLSLQVERVFLLCSPTGISPGHCSSLISNSNDPLMCMSLTVASTGKSMSLFF